MRVLVTGAYGLIGSTCLARLFAAGHEVIGAGRSIGTARRSLSYAQWIEADFARLADGAAWEPLLRNVDGVVNCVGVLQDGLRDNVQRVQFAGTKALFDGCVRAGVKRVVHISAIGADEHGPSAFSRSKAAGEKHLATLPLDWVVLRPGLVLAPGVYGGTAMLRGVAAFPGFVPLVGAHARIQVISADELAETVVRALAPGGQGGEALTSATVASATVASATWSKVSWEVAHPQVHTLADIATAIRGWLGLPEREVLALPDGIGKIIAAVADVLGWLGWRSPVRSTSLAQLTAGVIGDPKPWMSATGIEPKSLEQILAARPATVRDRWFARLYLLKPLAILGFAASTLSVGAQEFVAAGKLALAFWGISPTAVMTEVLPELVAAAVQFAIGILMLVRRTARFAFLALFVLTLLGTAMSIVAELHVANYPAGALAYAIPGLLALLFTLAVLDER